MYKFQVLGKIIGVTHEDNLKNGEMMHNTLSDPLMDVEHDVDFAEGLIDESEIIQEQECSLSQRIKKIREEKQFTLQKLAEATGFEQQLLEDIEQEVFFPPLGTVIKISKALNSSLGTLVHGEGKTSYAVTRKQSQQQIFRSTSSTARTQLYRYMGLASTVQGRHMEPLLVQLDEAQAVELSSHEGEEFIYVLEGEVLVSLDDEKITLAPGDSIYYQSQTPHQITAKSGRAKILAVIYEG
ncbi:MAG: XRE family transcriptional regulator [SAR324 cluster bacterium]|uniref:XRE family transcriptional regulator n=1 Tax=SAR324 cluster bacterium TaxID=2024889 RepID=A0A2A4SR79_9DELT|nr:MAG: XRE family transcriptional regulator [SAR324 cluster bacterium]